MSRLRTLVRALSIVVLASSVSAHAAVLTVTTTAMVVADDGQCSLPEAFESAKNDAAIFATPGECPAGSGADVLVLGVGQVYSATAGVADPVVGPTLALVTSDIEVIGNGSTIERAGGSPDFRLVASYTPGVVITLRNLTLSGGAATDTVAPFGQQGAAIAVADATVQLDRVTIRNSGGVSILGVGNAGVLNVLNSAVHSNAGAATVYVTGAGTLNMANTSIGLNTVSQDVFIDSAAAINVRHSTIEKEVAASNITGASDVTGNILAGGCSGTNNPGLAGGANMGPATCPLVTITDLTSIQAPADNGGNTLTAAIVLPSAAEDGNADCTFRSSGTNTIFTNGAAIATDQRLFARPAGACDIGAYEAARYNVAAAPPTGIVGQAYDSGTVTVDGATPFTAFTPTGLPPGLSVSTNAAAGQFNVVGTPTAAGTYALSFTATDANGMKSYQNFTLVVITTPGAPTLGTTTTGDAQATIAFTAPGSDGGSAITGYQVKCNSGAFVSASSLTSPITIALPNGATYDCQVYATNAAGEGAASANTNFTLAATTVSSVTRVGASPTPGPSVDFLVTFSRAVGGVDAADFALTATGLTGAAVTGVSGTGATRTVTVNVGTGSGTLRLDVVDNDTIVDVVGGGPLGGAGAGNGSFSTGEVYTITSVPGAPTITAITPLNGQAVIEFTPPASNGGSPITGYRAQCTPGPVTSASSPGSPITIALANGASYSCVVIATNANGDGPPSAAQNVALGVTAVSSIVRAAASPTAAASVTFTVTFSAPVTGVDPSDFALTTSGVTGASISSVTGSVNTYTVTVATGTGAGTIRLDLVDNDSINDGTAPLGGTGAGNGSFTTGEVYTVDRAAPTVASSNRVGAATVSGGAPQQFTVTFSEPVTGVDTADFALTATGTAAGTITGVSGSGTTYTVTVNITTGGASGGTLRLDVADNDSIGDALGNPLGGAGAGNGSFTTGQAYTVSAAATTTFSAASATGSGTITVAITGGGPTCTFQAPQFIPVEGHPRSPPAGSAPQGVVFPHGLFDFSLINCTPGSTVSFTITYPSSVTALNYYKYGPTPGSPAPHWYVLPATAAGNVMTFSITDGALGDDDLAANGTIADQGGPGTGTTVSEAIPTMSEWAMILMSLLLFGMAAGPLRRRRP